MVNFRISAPYKLDLLGDFSTHGLIGSINLRTTLTFMEYKTELHDIQLRYPELLLISKIPLELFNEMCKTSQNIERSIAYIIELSNYSCALNGDKFIKAFYFLLIYISQKEKIKIKPCEISISSSKECICPASFTVCVAACLIYLSGKQKTRSIYNFTFSDYRKIESYAALCKNYFSKGECGDVDVDVCTYGSMVRYQRDNGFEEIKRSISVLTFKYVQCHTSNTMLLLIDTKQKYNREALEQKITNFMNLNFPEDAGSILKYLDGITEAACIAAEQISNYLCVSHLLCTCEDKTREITNKRHTYAIEQNKILQKRIDEIRKVLETLEEPNIHLNKIYEIIESYGLDGKLTNLGNKLYVCVWQPVDTINIINTVEYSTPIILSQCWHALLEHGFNVTMTKLASTGVQIELNQSFDKSLSHHKFKINDYM